jgi:hypothetical protein
MSPSESDIWYEGRFWMRNWRGGGGWTGEHVVAQAELEACSSVEMHGIQDYGMLRG